MKTFKDIISEIAEPKAGDEKRFKDKHVVAITDEPHNGDSVHKAKTVKKKRNADTDLKDQEAVYEASDETMVCKDCGCEQGQPKEGCECPHDSTDLQASCWVSKESYLAAQKKNESVNEEEMTDDQMKKREDIVKSMKDDKDKFQAKYGSRWKEVMYATATKMAMKEDLDESKKAALAKKLAKASASSKKGKDKVTLKKAPFEIPAKEDLDEAMKIVHKAEHPAGGFYVVLTKGGSGNFVIRHLNKGKVKELGTVPSLGLAKAYIDAKQKGKDPKKMGVMGEEVQLDELTADEKKLVNQMYDKKGNLTDLGKKVMNHGKKPGDKGYVEHVELGEAVIDDLRSIVKSKSIKSVKFASGEKAKIDMFTASAMVKVHDALNSSNQKKFADAINKDERNFMKMMDFAMSKVGGK